MPPWSRRAPDTADVAERRLASIARAQLPDVQPEPAAPVPAAVAAPRSGRTRELLTGVDLLGDPGPRGTVALVVVAGVAVLVAGGLVWRARPVAVGAPQPAVVASDVPATPEMLVVDVAGDVRRPGIVRVPAGSRVIDAIAAAGGLKPGAVTAGLNLARKVSDGEQVYVGQPPAGTTSGAAAPAGGGKLDLNLASADQLDALPGIGPVLAKRIVDWRTAHGRFASVEQLGEVDGIGERTLARLRELVLV